MNKKSITYERVIKITEKLEKAMKTQDKELFNKWYAIAKKEKEEKFFNSIFIKNIKQMASQPNSEFFNFLVKEVKREFKTENLREVLLSVFSTNQVRNYTVLQDIWGKDFYKDDFFTKRTSTSLIGSYYLYNFSHDFETILDLHNPKDIYSYCEGIHLNNLENKSMISSMFNRLPQPDKTICLTHVLQKSIEVNKKNHIEFFYFKLVNDCEISKDVRDDLLICSLVQSIRKKDDNTYMSYKQQKEAQEYKIKLKEVVNNPLTDEMLTPGGQFFKFLLDKVELKEKLESLQVIERPAKRNKI